MIEANIKKENTIIDNVLYFRIMLKKVGWFSSWTVEYSSKTKEHRDDMFNKIKGARNIGVER